MLYMGGSLLQLVATNIEDIFITGDPEITLFKIVYRRHVAFSQTQLNLNFKGKTTFGRKIIADIKRKGDLLKNLTLVFKIPEIEMIYEKKTNNEISQLLKKNYIEWSHEEPSSFFVKSSVDEIETLIQNKIDSYNEEIDLIDSILEIIDEVDDSLSVNEYYETVVEAIIDIDPSFNQLYDKIEQFFENEYPTTLIKTVDTLKDFYKQEINSFVFKLPEAYRLDFDNDYSIMNQNFDFINKIEYAFIDNNSSISLSTLLTNYIADVYESENNTTYTQIDAYKIFDSYITQNELSLNGNFDFFKIRLDIINHLKLNLRKNIQMLSIIFSNLIREYTFFIYRRFRNDSTTGSYLTSEKFTNMSLNALQSIDDNFTKQFVINAVEGEPTITHYYNSYVTEKLTEFHTDNQNLFRDSKLNGYFNNLNLWTSLSVPTIITTGLTSSEKRVLTGILPLDFIPIVMIVDILTALVNSVDFDADLSDFITTKIKNEDDVLIDAWIEEFDTEMREEIINDDFITELKTIATNKSTDNDIIIVSILKKFTKLTFDSQEYHYVDYVIVKWLDKLNTLIDEYVIDNPSFGTDKINKLISVVESFRTSYDSLPEHTTYEKSYSLARLTNEPEIVDDPVSFSEADKIIDAGSSIWKYIQSSFIDNFNGIFNNDILDDEHLVNNMGKEASLYFHHIIEPDLTTIDLGDSYDYYNITQEIIDEVIDSTLEDSLNKRITNFNYQLTNYDNNKEFLLINRISINKKNLMYGEISNMMEQFESFFNTNVKNELADEDLINNIRTLIEEGGTDSLGNVISPLYGTMDIINSDSNTNDLQDYIENEFVDDPDTIELFNTQLNWTSSKFYSSHTFILKNYNKFATAQDIKDFILDELQKKTIINAGAKTLKKTTVIETKNAFVDYFTTKKNKLLDNISTLENEIIDLINNYAKGGEPSNFAWCKRLGHHLIKKISLIIGGQTIDIQTGVLMNINRSLTEPKEKERGYNEMIGDISELTTFNNKIKKANELFVPLQLWFCRNDNGFIPLVNLIHTDIQIHIELAELNEVAYWESGTVFKKHKPRIYSHLIGDYILLDPEERKRMTNSKLEFLIETYQYDDSLIINKDFFINGGNEIRKRFYFKNNCKEMIWCFQRMKDINGSLDNKEIKWNNYGLEYTNKPASMEYLFDTFELYFNSVYREEKKSAKYYNYVQSSKHTRTPEKGIYCYNYSLYPDKFQPSGTVNLSMIELLEGRFIFNQDVINEILNNNEEFKLVFIVKTYNIFRCLSGMGGLAFDEC
jgi:hypothetical protein